MALEKWHNELFNHFKLLESRRQHDFPIFAIEHELSSQQMEQLKIDIEAALNSYSSYNQDWYFPWVVYATEIGYEYSGDEYWQTFKEKTNSWIESEYNKNFIKGCFLRFEHDFRTIKPVGDWATFFNRISRPIINSILPKDIQFSLLKILFEIRTHITNIHMQDIELLGNIIRENSWSSTSRFQIFAQNTRLIGQFTKALIDSSSNLNALLISEKTFHRIENDLSIKEKSKMFLNEIRKKVSLIKLEGVRIKPYTGNRENIEDFYRGNNKIISTRPSIYLSLTNNNSWDVFLHIPSMTFLLKWSEKFRKILNEGRVRITNSVRSNPFPARNLLYRDNDIALVKWPGEGEPLIEFLLGNELQYRIDINNIYESTKLLCFQYTHQNKVIHVSQNMLEYNKDYVFLYNNADVDKILGEYDEIKLNSSGIKARKIKINNIEYSRLRELGFSILKDITFKPIANPTSSNDYVGVYEYPSKEKPTFLVVSNSRINKLRLVLSDDRVLCSLELSDIIPQEKRIIQLSSLKVGNYSLKIEAEIQSEDAIINTNGLVEIYIRDMDSLSVKVKTPLQFYISPYNPTLEDFWEMKYKVKILGPRNYNLTPEISLFDKSKKTIFHTKLSKLSLPVEQKKWIDSFLNFKKNNTQIGRTYDEAYSSELIFADKNLGSVKHSFERNFIPVRWAIKQSQGKYMLKLMIDSDTFEKVDVFRYEFTSPSVKHKIDTEQFKQFSFIEQKGGLYLAEYGGVSKGIIAPSSASRSLQDLYVNHNVIKIARNNLEVINSIENVSIWSSAKQSGNQLAYLHQLQIYYDLTQNLIRTVCGDRWVNEEQLVLDSYPINFIRYKLIPLLQNRSVENYLNNRVNFNNFVESDLLCKIDSLENIFNSVYYFRELKYFKHLYESSSMKTASDFLLRFANSPQRIMELDKEFVNIGIKSILEHPILLKLARVLVIYYRKFYQISDDNFCWGWEWS